jgi:hypothetical protein
MRVSFCSRMVVAAAAAAVAMVEASLAGEGLGEGFRLRRSSGDGEEVPLRAARGGGARDEDPEEGAPPVPVLREGEAGLDGRAPALARDGEEALPRGTRRFSGGVMILRGIGDGEDGNTSGGVWLVGGCRISECSSEFALPMQAQGCDEREREPCSAAKRAPVEDRLHHGMDESFGDVCVCSGES